MSGRRQNDNATASFFLYQGLKVFKGGSWRRETKVTTLHSTPCTLDFKKGPEFWNRKLGKCWPTGTSGQTLNPRKRAQKQSRLLWPGKLASEMASAPLQCLIQRPNGCFHKAGVLLVGVLATSALSFHTIWGPFSAPDFWKLPHQFRMKEVLGFTYGVRRSCPASDSRAHLKSAASPA